MRDHRKAEEIAAQRMQLLSPLLAQDVDAAKARQLRGPDLRADRDIRAYRIVDDHMLKRVIQGELI